MSTLFILILLKFGFSLCQSQLPYSCESAIFCHGDILHTVQTLEIFRDQKTFVDLQLKFPEATIIRNFKALPVKDVPSIRQFVSENFFNCSDTTVKCPDELVDWVPPDWIPNPSIVDRITVPHYKEWAKELNLIWKELGRKMDESVKDKPDLTSLIYVPNGFVVPGGRFRELYYWDTYWIINGLLICDMKETAKGVIENLISLVKLKGHIPNGSRVYYWQRTQPPMLSLMVESYLNRTNDVEFVKNNIEWLDQEMQYYLSNRRVTVEKLGEKYEMFRYYAPSSGPRPESYNQDFTLAAPLKTDEEKQKLYSNLKSAAESGWDFSSRWFIKDGSNQGTLHDINTENIIPVDLNALLHKCFCLLGEWYRTIAPDNVKADFYEQLSDGLLRGIDNVLWSEEDGIWFDYDILNNKPRNYFYLSNFTPLWTQSYRRDRKLISENVIRYFDRTGLFRFIGGTPTSTSYSNEQWDFPNAWAPLQAFVIQGMERTGTEAGFTVASHLANAWLESNYKGFKKDGKMFEKYDVTALGKSGTGGEYEGQAGFGWTNGLVFELLETWGSSSSWHNYL